MRFYCIATSIAFLATAAAAAALGGCGYLPSEMNGGSSKSNTELPDGVHASIVARQQFTNCNSAAKGYHRVTFKDLYNTTGDRDTPFVPSPSAPAQYDVTAYVWGSDNCSQTGRCSGGDHYWLIERGPGDEFTTWVVTPQFPRIVIQSTCRNRLKVGERFRFSFSHGKLLGFSRR
ncbi:hypothetical protein [Microbulbifer sp. SAOS-129_SWC]|uniref:hypothetical protein n=1 Tax=Microbulbifer sp. SAOS-129_SWC TaxID=3145235 RepID=UPI003216A849